MTLQRRSVDSTSLPVLSHRTSGASFDLRPRSNALASTTFLNYFYSSSLLHPMTFFLLFFLPSPPSSLLFTHPRPLPAPLLPAVRCRGP